MTPVACFQLPLRTRNTLNQREHWAARHRRTKKERKAVALLFPWRARGLAASVPAGHRLVVHLQRSGPRMLDDDGLRAALKSVRDEVARQLGCDDADARLRFSYEPQQKGRYGVTVALSFEETT